MTDIEIVQTALEKSRDNGWPARKSHSIRCYKDDGTIIALSSSKD